mgnify:CR=1 FL=1
MKKYYFSLAFLVGLLIICMTAKIKLFHVSNVPERILSNVPKRILYMDSPEGRLGNKMFQLAASISMAKEFDFDLFIDKRLAHMLHGFKPVESMLYGVGFPRIDTKHWITLDETKSPYKFNPYILNSVEKQLDVKLQGYFQSWKYFENITSTIRDLFTLSDEFKAAAYTIMENITTNYTKSVTFVGIHVRRGDTVSRYQYRAGARTPNVSYLLKSMDYYKSKYSHVHFIMCSDDPNWCHTKLTI